MNEQNFVINVFALIDNVYVTNKRVCKVVHITSISDCVTPESIISDGKLYP